MWNINAAYVLKLAVEWDVLIGWFIFQGPEMSYRLERRVSGAIKASLVPQANDTRQLTRTTKV